MVHNRVRLPFAAMLICAFGIAAPFMAGCSSAPVAGVKTENSITLQKTVSIKQGVSGRDEVQSVFGKPDDIFITPKGEIYYYTDWNLKVALIYFNSDGIVTDVYVSD